MTVKTTTTHTVESIKTLLATSNAAVERALVVLYERQTADEQATESTHNVNGVGFSAFDAQILSSFACQVNSKVGQFDSYLKRERKLGECLSPKQMTLARSKVSRYARQLAEIANGKMVTTPEQTQGQEEQTTSPTLTFWLITQGSGQGWQQLSQERAAAWHKRMMVLVAFNRINAKVKPFEQAAPGVWWMNTVGDLLQVLAEGEQPDMEKWAKKAAAEELALQAQEEEAKQVAARMNELAAQGRYEDAAEMAEAFAVKYEVEEEGLEEKGWHQGHSAATIQSDPEARTFRSARDSIARWIAK